MAQIRTIKRVAIATDATEHVREFLRHRICARFPAAHVWIGTPLVAGAYGITVSGSVEADEWAALKTLQGLLANAEKESIVCKCGHTLFQHWSDDVGCRFCRECRRFEKA